MKREQALSEVIGFLMIIALLGILFSMYLLYVVPIQGKDAEIAHMKYVSQQFIDLKSDIDSLIINERINVPIARSFELGTLSSTGQGSLSILPIQGFIEAAGTLVVNQQMDFLSIQGDFLTTEIATPDEYLKINSDIAAMWKDQENLYVYYPGINSINNTVKGNTSILNTTYSIINNTTYTTIVQEPTGYFKIYPEYKPFINKIVRAYDLDPYYEDPQKKIDQEIISWVMNTTPNATLNNTTDYLIVKNQTDIIIDFFNSSEYAGNSTRWYRRTLQENATTNPHVFDLSKINEIKTTDTRSVNYTLSGTIGSTSSSSSGAQEWKIIDQPLQPLGSLQYWSQNRYWINQELLYEMGGLFLKQNEGVSIMLIPSLSITPLDTTSGTNIRVSLVDVSITDTNDVSGSKSAQIFAKVDSVVKNQLIEEVGTNQLEINTMPEGQANTKYLIITFKPQDLNDADTTKLWKRAFDQVFVITQKTMSERQVGYDIANSMITWYGDGTTEPLSASLIIANDLTSSLTGESFSTLDDIKTILNSKAGNLRPFYFEYTKARVSLVIQSGAL